MTRLDHCNLHGPNIARYDIPLDIGPTVQGITRGQTIYFFDPCGSRNEVFSGGFIDDPDNPQPPQSGASYRLLPAPGCAT